MTNNSNIVDIIGLASKYPVISRVGVFGSYARGEQTETSDIDILYDYDRINEDYVLDILAYAEELADKFEHLNIDFDYVSYKGVIDSSNSKIQNRIMHDVVWMYERV